MPDDPEVFGPQLPNTPENTPDEAVEFTLIEEEFANLSLEGAAKEAALILKIEELKSKIQERDRAVLDITADRDQIREAFGQAVQQVNTLTVANEELEEAYNSVMMPAWGFAVVTGVYPDERLADIISEGHRNRVSIHAALDVTDLRVGQRVVLNGKTLAIVQIADDLGRTGMQANVNEWLSETTVLVEDSRGDKRVVLAGDSLTSETLQPGTDVLLDESVIVGPLSGNRGTSLGLGSRFLLAKMPDVTFDDIGGLDDELRRVIAALENPHLVPEGYAALRHKPTFSAIFVGLPGNGKTMIAKAIARRQFDRYREQILKYASGNFFVVNGTEIYEKWLGNTEGYLRGVIGDAQRLFHLTGAISTVFFDDCDALFRSRGLEMSTNINGAVNTQFSTLIDGVAELEGVSLIGASNRLDLMDAATVRRFGRQVVIRPPDTPRRATAVLTKHLRDVPFRDISADAAIRQLVGDIFAPTPENELVEVFFMKADSGDDSIIVRLCDVISGKFLCDIVDNAKNLVIEREATKAPTERSWTLTYEDLRASMETELRNKESLPMDRKAVADWLAMKGDKREVDYVVNLREMRKGEARRNRQLDKKVV